MMMSIITLMLRDSDHIAFGEEVPANSDEPMISALIGNAWVICLSAECQDPCGLNCGDQPSAGNPTAA
jgi:hypothetical protein